MSEMTQDEQGNLHIGPYGDARKARLTIDFDAGDPTSGKGIDVKANAAGVASVKLGGFTIGQTAAGTFQVTDSAGNILPAFSSDGTTPGSAYIEALAISTDYHANQNQQGLDALAALAGVGTQAVANARANALKTAMIAHMASVGTRTARGSHKNADTANSATLAAVADASDLATSITLVNALLVAINTHNNQATRHFHDDATSVTITTDPPTTLAHVRTDCDDLLAAMVTHMAAGAA